MFFVFRFLAFRFLVVCVLSALGFVHSVHAQSAETALASAADNVADEQITAAINLGVSSGGMRRQVPGRWAMLALGGSNPTNRAREETIAVIVDGESNLQYARRVWMPGGARRLAWLPIQIPADVAYDQNMIDFSSIQIHHDVNGSEAFQQNVVGMPSTRSSLMLSKEKSRAAIILDQVAVGDDDGNEQNRDIADTVNAGRDLEVKSGRDEGLVHVQDHFLPPSPVGLDSIDQIVIASERILNDTLSLSRLQGWLQAGGRVWVMADRVSPEAAQVLLGDEMCYSVVDRVELNRVTYASNAPSQGGEEQLIEVWESERPVELVRVFTEATEVFCTVDGWPAAFQKRVGRGSVMFTTIGARGWVRDGVPLKNYEKLSSYFFSGRDPAPQPLASLTSFVDDEIGYSIPRRSLIAMLLGLHLTILVLTGVWLAKRHALQYLAIVIPIAALIVAGTFIAIGRQQTSAVPSTIAVSQIIRNLPGNPVVNLHSVAALYSQTERPLNIVSSADSTTLLGQGRVDGQVHRLQWDDSGQSKWLFVNQPPGVVRHLKTESEIELSPAWVARATFTKEGFQAQVQGLPSDRSEDAVVVATPAPILAVRFDPDMEQTLVSGRDDVLSPGQFIDAAIVSDVQRKRQELLREMLASDSAPFGHAPILLAWTDPIDSGAQFDDDLNRRGSALASVPIQLTPPPNGTEFHVPATFVRIEPHSGSRGLTAVFNARTGEWLELNQPRETEIQCMMPREMLPCILKRVGITIKINAPSRTLKIKSLADGEFINVYQKANPSGVIRLEIDDPQSLELNDFGGLVLSLDISPSEEERGRSESDSPQAVATNGPSRSTWKIDYVHVEFDATMQ